MVETRPAQRKLAAILAADVAGYSRLMGADEEGILGRCCPRYPGLRACLWRPATGGGRIPANCNQAQSVRPDDTAVPAIPRARLLLHG